VGGGEIRSIFSAQGQAYAEAAYGSTDGFIQRVLMATGDARAGDGGRGIGGSWRPGGNRAIPGVDAGAPASLSITA
jgi:hypothetical protein